MVQYFEDSEFKIAMEYTNFHGEGAGRQCTIE
jgi:hypothetical protein